MNRWRHPLYPALYIYYIFLQIGVFEMMEPSYQDAKDLQPVIQRWRRELHQIPEIGLKLPKTEAYVKEQLCKMGLTYREFPTHSGLVVDIGRPGQLTVAVRADMDALPIQEETGLDFSSTNENMHACGHDAHTAMLLGLAQLLKTGRARFPAWCGCCFSPERSFRAARNPWFWTALWTAWTTYWRCMCQTRVRLTVAM